MYLNIFCIKANVFALFLICFNSIKQSKTILLCRIYSKKPRKALKNR